MALDEPVLALPKGLALQRTLRGATGNINEIAWSPDGRWLASGDPDGRIGVWDVSGGEQRLRLERGEKLVWSLAWSPTGNRLASGTNEGTVTVYQTESGEPLETFGHHGSWVRSVAWSPVGDKVASGANDKKVMVWDLEKGECQHVFEGHRDRVLGVRFSPDGQLLASAGGDGDVIVWSLANNEPIARHHLKNGWQRSVCFSPDGRLVAAGGEDGAVRLLRVADGRLAAVLEGHREGVGCVQFDATGQLLASRSVDGRIRLWSPSRGSWRLLARIKAAPSFPMANLAFHPKQSLLAAVDHNRIRLWEIELEALRHAADGLPTAPVRTAKLLVTGHGTADILEALQTQPIDLPQGVPASLLDKQNGPDLPTCHRLGEPPSRKTEQRELILWDLGNAAGQGRLDPAAFASGAAAVLVGLRADAHDPLAELHALAERLGRRLPAPAPVVLGILDGPLPPGAGGAAGPLALPLAGLLPLEWLSRCRDGLFELADDETQGVSGSSATTRELEALLDDELAAGRWVTTEDDLLRQLVGRDPIGGADESRRRQLDLGLRQLELRGRLRRLRPGGLVVARGVAETYAAALRRRAEADPRALGALSEQEAQDGKLELPEKLRLEGQLDDVLRLGVLRDLAELGLLLRAPFAGEPHVFFPDLFAAGRPPRPPGPAEPRLAEARIAGDPAFALTGLATRVADGHAFALAEVWADGLVFTSPLGGRFSVMLKVSEGREDGGEPTLLLAGEAPAAVGKLFAETALAELARLPICRLLATSRPPAEKTFAGLELPPELPADAAPV